MSLARSPWRLAAVLMVSSLALVQSLGCKGKASGASTAAAGTVTVSGKVTYQRPPLLTNTAGVPTGLETDATKFQTLPARGVLVRFYEQNEETNPDGTKTKVWRQAGPDASTDATGAYTASVPKDKPVFVEIRSHFASSGVNLRVLADPAGIGSGLPQAERPVYGLRKGLDGTAPTGNATPGTLATGSTATVNFDVTLADKWWITSEAPALAPSATLESSATGSRVLAIGDSAYTFTLVYGSPTPGDTLDLHYLRGLSDPRGSFVEYDRSVYPLSFDSATSSRHYFASLKGGTSNDDAFDEGVIFPLLARNNLFGLVAIAQTPAPALLPVQSPLANLTPAMALIEGFADAMAASLLKSPYLADTTPSSALVRDIRDLGGLSPAQKTLFAAPLLRALAWDLTLKANSLPNPGLPTDWAKIDANALRRFFGPRTLVDANSVITDGLSLYSQLARFKETKSGTEPVDLATLFTDATLTPLLQTYAITWPRPATGPYAGFLQDWGADPNSATKALPIQAFSMANAVQVRGAFPNVSAGEVTFAKFTLSKDFAFNVSLSGLPAGAQIEAHFDGDTYTFGGSAGTSARVILRGNATTPILHQVRWRLLSPSVQLPDFQATVRIDVAL